MKPKQSAMARAGLGWSLTEWAKAAGVGRATAARFELGQPVSDDLRGKLENALLERGAQFADRSGRVTVSVPG